MRPSECPASSCSMSKLHVGLDDFAGSLRLGGCGKGWRCCWFRSWWRCCSVWCSLGVPRFSVVWLWLRSDTPWPRPTPARGSKCNCCAEKCPSQGQSRRDRRKRIPGAARSFFHQLARAWEQSSLAGLVSLLQRAARRKNVPMGGCGVSPLEGVAEDRAGAPCRRGLQTGGDLRAT